MSNQEFVVADTVNGQVKGVKKLSCLDEEYISFQGIPFAKPPIGKLRFKDPQPVENWEGVLDATKEKSPCYGFNTILNKIVGDEDSLHLNVFTKNLKPKKTYAVMVYIYGGAFKTGSNSTSMYAPDFLLMHDIILVSMNYRLGAFGFLSFDDPSLEIPGNAGLKDQNLALRWVKNNIHHFGGDPNNVTLIGESAGGCSVHHHMLSKQSKGLFHKGVPMSGNALHSWAIVPNNNWAERLAKNLGWNGEGGPAEILEYLENADPVQIVIEQEKVRNAKESFEFHNYPFSPTVEPYITEKTFIAEAPVVAHRNAWSKDMDILIGGTSNEGLFYMKYVRDTPDVLKRLKTLVNLLPSKTEDESKNLELALKLQHLYYGDTDPTSNSDGICRLMTDSGFWHGNHRVIMSRIQAKHTGKTYIYRFDMDSPTQNHHRIKQCGPNVKGVCHADELSYIFKNSYSELPDKSTDEFKVIKVMVSILAAFVISGNPNNSELGNLVWEPIDTTEPPFKCLNISNENSIIDQPETERLAFWDKLYADTNTILV